jgi:hypothetical protein
MTAVDATKRPAPVQGSASLSILRHPGFVIARLAGDDLRLA